MLLKNKGDLNENGTTKSWWKRKAEKTDSGLIHA
jgi:hypothetical protein